MRFRTIVLFAAVACLTACATPVPKVAALTATEIGQLETDIQAKLDAEKAFAAQIAKDGKFAAKWNVKIANEIALLRGVQEFTDLALTRRAGVPRVALQDFLRADNEKALEAATGEAAAIAREEARLAVTFEKVVFQRQKWRDAQAATLKLARKRSSEERFRALLETAKESWRIYQKSVQETMTNVVDEPLSE